MPKGLARVYENSPRRDRVIYKALLRAKRRWDLYAAMVKRERMPGEVAENTDEWKLVTQNGELLRRLRDVDFMPERKDRLDAADNREDRGLGS